MTGGVKDWYLPACVGQAPLPSSPDLLQDFVRWAQRQHILGQVAAAQSAGENAKLAEIFENARLRSAYDQRMLRFEADRIRRALMGSGIRLILLKGSAYIAADLFAGIGRRVSDIDILVDEKDLQETEKLLSEAGWIPEATTADDYDQQYYREWMHELPPMRHRARRTLIDVHHRLLPRTARIQPDHIPMMAASVPLEGSELRAFSPQDRFIHSAIHIFADGMLDTPARSLIELRYLFKDLSEQDKTGLTDRAGMLAASAPVVTALWSVGHFFGDKAATDALKQHRPCPLLRWCINAVVREGAAAGPARICLYLRSHYMRMPLIKLIHHLGVKALKRLNLFRFSQNQEARAKH